MTILDLEAQEQEKTKAKINVSGIKQPEDYYSFW